MENPFKKLLEENEISESPAISPAMRIISNYITNEEYLDSIIEVIVEENYPIDKVVETIVTCMLYKTIFECGQGSSQYPEEMHIACPQLDWEDIAKLARALCMTVMLKAVIDKISKDF